MSPSASGHRSGTLHGDGDEEGPRRAEVREGMLGEVDLSHMTSCSHPVKHAADYEREEEAYWASESPMAAAQASSNPPIQQDYKEALYDLANHSWRQLGDVHVISDGDDVTATWMLDEASDEAVGEASPCGAAACTDRTLPVPAHAGHSRQATARQQRSRSAGAAILSGLAGCDGRGDQKACLSWKARGSVNEWPSNYHQQHHAAAGSGLLSVAGSISSSSSPLSPPSNTRGSPFSQFQSQKQPSLHVRCAPVEFSLFHFPVLPQPVAPINAPVSVAASIAGPLTAETWGSSAAAAGAESEYRLFARGSKASRPGMAVGGMGRVGTAGGGGLSVPVM